MQRKNTDTIRDRNLTIEKILDTLARFTDMVRKVRLTSKLSQPSNVRSKSTLAQEILYLNLTHITEKSTCASKCFFHGIRLWRVKYGLAILSFAVEYLYRKYEESNFIPRSAQDGYFDDTITKKLLTFLNIFDIIPVVLFITVKG